MMLSTVDAFVDHDSPKGQRALTEAFNLIAAWRGGLEVMPGELSTQVAGELA